MGKTERFSGNGTQMFIHAQKDKTRLYSALCVKTEQSILIGLFCLKLAGQRIQVRHETIQVWHLAQFLPILKEKEHQIAAQLGIGFRHLVSGKLRDQLDRIFEDAQAALLDAKGDRSNGPAPSCKCKLSILTCEILSDFVCLQHTRIIYRLVGSWNAIPRLLVL